MKKLEIELLDDSAKDIQKNELILHTNSYYEKLAWFLFGFSVLLGYSSVINTLTYVDSLFSFGHIQNQITFPYFGGATFACIFGPYISQQFSFKKIILFTQILILASTICYPLIAYFLQETHLGYKMLLIIGFIMGFSTELNMARMFSYSSFFDNSAIIYFTFGLAVVCLFESLLQILIMIIWNDPKFFYTQIIIFILLLSFIFIMNGMLLFNYMKTHRIDKEIESDAPEKIFDWKRIKLTLNLTSYELATIMFNFTTTLLVFPSIIIEKKLNCLNFAFSTEILILLFGSMDSVGRLFGGMHSSSSFIMAIICIITKTFSVSCLMLRYFSDNYFQHDIDLVILLTVFSFFNGYFCTVPMKMQQDNLHDQSKENKEFGAFMIVIAAEIGLFLGSFIQQFL